VSPSPESANQPSFLGGELTASDRDSRVRESSIGLSTSRAGTPPAWLTPLGQTEDQPDQAARRYRWCSPPTIGIATISSLLPRSGAREFGASPSRAACPPERSSEAGNTRSSHPNDPKRDESTGIELHAGTSGARSVRYATCT
jgi:hypothetical protein